MNDWEFLSPVQSRNFSFCHHFRNARGAHPASYPMGNVGKAVKLCGYHSGSPNARVKNEWTHPRQLMSSRHGV